LLPARARSTGWGQLCRPQKRAQRRGVTHRAGEVEPVYLAQLAEEELVEALEDACLLPFVEATPAGQAGAVSELLREPLSGDPSAEHEHDPG
jgi:hypothetical protein